MTTDDNDLEEQKALMQKKLDGLILEHRDLDDVISVVASSRAIDLMKLKRLKKRKLSIKDEIRYIQSKLLPDIIA